MAWPKIAQVFSLSSQWGDNTIRLVEGDNAMAKVKHIEEGLQDSLRVLQSHEQVLASGEFNVFSIKRRHLELKVYELKHELRREQDKSVFSSAPAGRGMDRITRDVVRLQNQAEIFHQDLLTASRRAQIAEEERFFGHVVEDSSQTESSTTPESTWYSVITPMPSADSTSESSSDTALLADYEPLVGVHHTLPEGSVDGSKEGPPVMTITMRQGNELLTMMNLNGCTVDELCDLNSRNSVHAAACAGRDFLQLRAAGKVQSYKVIEPPSEDSWIHSLANGLARLGVV